MTTLDRPKLPWASGTISRPLSLGLSVHLNMQSTNTMSRGTPISLDHKRIHGCMVPVSYFLSASSMKFSHERERVLKIEMLPAKEACGVMHVR